MFTTKPDDGNLRLPCGRKDFFKLSPDLHADTQFPLQISNKKTEVAPAASQSEAPAPILTALLLMISTLTNCV